ncbi:hypothetical protein I5E68_17270 [Novosphingobium sp. YJ-S2-02]|uniref:Uncharacterized protein n=1 Tax=Novosphingobium aureum TaxID=2792964 RepID=A0A931HEK2_9SPHN|nr:hypothetical protein [Novosphingobium aureum]MBH0114702.1 hypothetical protein [Novosphingobium aureum]
MTTSKHLLVPGIGALALAFQPLAAVAQNQVPSHPEALDSAQLSPTFADIAALADSAGLVVHARIRKAIRVKNERAPGLAPGSVRFYVEADTLALLSGSAPLGESIRYLVDLPLDARGKEPNLKKREVLLFARAVPGRPGEIQLLSPDAQQTWSQEAEARVRRILQAMVAPDAPAKVTGVREIIFVPGTLAGQGETQVFLNTDDGSAASLTVRHVPGAQPVWGVSFSELVADVGRPPRRDTLEWYRLACFLPARPPVGANMSEGAALRAQAEADYRFVMQDLGPCRRTLG